MLRELVAQPHCMHVYSSCKVALKYVYTKYVNLYQQLKSSNLRIRSGCDILIYSSGQGFIIKILLFSYWKYHDIRSSR